MVGQRNEGQRRLALLLCGLGGASCASAMEADIAPYRAERSVDIIRANLEGAKYTLAVPKYTYDAGLKSFADIVKFKDELDAEIYGIEPGNDGNRLILEMIAQNAFDLEGFELVESSEQGMTTISSIDSTSPDSVPTDCASADSVKNKEKTNEDAAYSGTAGRRERLCMTIEDTWGGDITTAAIAHLARSTPAEFTFSATDFNSYGTVDIAEGAPKRVNGRMTAADRPGLGIAPIFGALGDPVARYSWTWPSMIIGLMRVPQSSRA